MTDPSSLSCHFKISPAEVLIWYLYARVKIVNWGLVGGCKPFPIYVNMEIQTSLSVVLCWLTLKQPIGIYLKKSWWNQKSLNALTPLGPVTP